MFKAFKILVGQSRNEIKMEINILETTQFLHHLFQPHKVHLPADFFYGNVVCGLHTDFKLHQPWPHIFQNLQFLLA